MNMSRNTYYKRHTTEELANALFDIDERVLDYYESLKEDINYKNYTKKELFTKAANYFYE